MIYLSIMEKRYWILREFDGFVELHSALSPNNFDNSIINSKVVSQR